MNFKCALTHVILIKIIIVKKIRALPDVQSMFKFKNIELLFNLIVFLLGIQYSQWTCIFFLKLIISLTLTVVKSNPIPTLNIFIWLDNTEIHNVIIGLRIV